MISGKYDDASWYSGAVDFPKELPPSAGATHIGMFFVWAVLNDLCSEAHFVGCADEVAKLKLRKCAPGAYVYKNLDGKLLTEDFNSIGNLFASTYLDLSEGAFLEGYAEALIDDAEGDLDIDLGSCSVYRFEDSWENYDRIAPVISVRFASWQKEHSS